MYDQRSYEILVSISDTAGIPRTGLILAAGSPFLQRSPYYTLSFERL